MVKYTVWGRRKHKSIATARWNLVQLHADDGYVHIDKTDTTILATSSVEVIGVFSSRVEKAKQKHENPA